MLCEERNLCGKVGGKCGERLCWLLSEKGSREVSFDTCHHSLAFDLGRVNESTPLHRTRSMWRYAEVDSGSKLYVPFSKMDSTSELVSDICIAARILQSCLRPRK